MRVRQLDELKSYLLKRFFHVLAVVVIGSTILIQAPGVARVRSVLEEIRQMSKQQPVLLPSRGQTQQWESKVPDFTLAETARFKLQLQRMASAAGCSLSDRGSTSPIKEGEDLAIVDTNCRLVGSFYALQRFFSVVRQQRRTLAITSGAFQPTDWPEVQADVTIRRYLWQGVPDRPTE